MEYHVGLEAGKDGFHPAGAAHVADDGMEGQCGIFLFQLQSEVVHGRFAVVEQY